MKPTKMRASPWERAEKSALEGERESLPGWAYRAGLDENFELKDALKERYRNARPAIEALRGRVAELEEEIAALVGPNPALPGGTIFDAQISAFSRVRDAYRDAAAPLVALQTTLSGLLRDAVDPLLGGQRGWGQTLQSVRSQRAGDPEVRARSLQRRGLRPEFSGAKREA